MKVRSTAWAGLGVAGATATLIAWADGGGSPVQFPPAESRPVHYATVERGGIREELYTSQAAIQAAKAGQPLPAGTVIFMEDFRDGKLFRYIVMEKRKELVGTVAPAARAGDWAFQSFGPGQQINRSEDVRRCMACHQPQARNDFVFTYDRMKAFEQRK